MITTCNRADERFYGFSFIELVDGLSKLMVRGRTHKYIDQNLVNLLLTILEKPHQDDSLLECVSNAILNASFDEKVQRFLESKRAIEIITSAGNNSSSQLVQKNCEAILWTLNRIPHRGRTPLLRTALSDPFHTFSRSLLDQSILRITRARDDFLQSLGHSDVSEDSRSIEGKRRRRTNETLWP